MITLNAQIIRNKGRNEYAVIPYEEFLRLQEELHDYEDLRCLREAKEAEKDAATVGIDILKRRIVGRTSRSTGSPKKRASR
jgi:PHD/YefM family antitoxin component YafN of YafNO toxin-antitoxin module